MKLNQNQSTLEYILSIHVINAGKIKLYYQAIFSLVQLSYYKVKEHITNANRYHIFSKLLLPNTQHRGIQLKYSEKFK